LAPPGLRYVNLAAPGLRRIRSGRGFRYTTARGVAMRDPATLARIRHLAIPPAWNDVWIATDARAHIQAVGRDAKGRKQYRYHALWREARDEAKYERLGDFAKRLPGLRARTARDLTRPDLDRAKVVAAVVRLLEATLIRVGNEEYARQNRSYGLTTLRNRHATVSGARVEFRFRGKSKRDHVVVVKDRPLGAIVKACQDLPGRALFQYLDERGRRRVLTSADVNAYLREALSADFSAKDFRTWAGTVLAACLLRQTAPPRSERDGKRQLTRAIESVSSRLGNTPAICRRSYVHPAVIEAYLDGSLPEAPGAIDRVRSRLKGDERALLSFLESRSK
jgi:DNA topoisomerase-1